MAPFVLLLLALFLIGCVLFGIAAGVQIIQRGFAWATDWARNDTPPAPPASAPLPPHTAQSPPADAADTPSLQHGVYELREIFTLYREGALTREEFENMKQHLLHKMKATTLPRH